MRRDCFESSSELGLRGSFEGVEELISSSKSQHSSSELEDCVGGLIDFTGESEERDGNGGGALFLYGTFNPQCRRGSGGSNGPRDCEGFGRRIRDCCICTEFSIGICGDSM